MPRQRPVQDDLVSRIGHSQNPRLAKMGFPRQKQLLPDMARDLISKYRTNQIP